MKRILLASIACCLLLASCLVASAKTLESAKAETIFFYAADARGKAVLLKTMPLSDLKELAHGRADGRNYCVSSTDNYPTTQYCEARGFTVPELLDYVKSVTDVKGAEALGFAGGDTIRLMATDSYGNYNRSWTHDELYGVKRYYFEGLFDAEGGWKTAWEIAGEDSAKFGLTLDEYNARHRAEDPYYADKRAVFAGGVQSVPILATESFSGRTTTDTLVASTEIGIAGYIAKNGGRAAGCLKDALTDATALRLALPMTEADLMAAHRTAYDNFKWTYNLKLEPERPPAALKSLGTVAEPLARVTQSGDALTISMTCATPGARVYYSFDGAPQTRFTAPVTVDVKGRDLASDPVTFCMTAVKEGYDDAGVLTFKHPGTAPAFKTRYSAPAGRDLTFEAADGVSGADWKAWTKALRFVMLKTPASGGYVKVDAAKYRLGDAGIAFDKSLFGEAGAYSFVFHASGYANKSASLAVKREAAELSLLTKAPAIGLDLTFKCEDADFWNGVTVYVRPKDGEPSMIPTSRTDRARTGELTLKADYFASPSCPVREAGEYVFTFTNSRFEPASLEIEVTLGAAPAG